MLFDVGMLVDGLFGTTSNIPNGNLHGAPGYEDLHFLDVGKLILYIYIFQLKGFSFEHSPWYLLFILD